MKPQGIDLDLGCKKEKAVPFQDVISTLISTFDKIISAEK
jgi:hypothetical protein